MVFFKWKIISTAFMVHKVHGEFCSQGCLLQIFYLFIFDLSSILLPAIELVTDVTCYNNWLDEQPLPIWGFLEFLFYFIIIFITHN